MTGPVRRVRRVRGVPLWSLVVGVVVVFASPLISIYASVRIAENNAARVAAEQRRTEAEATAEAHRIVCQFFALNLDVYDETPPASPLGRNLRQTYVDLYRISGCQPPRK